MRSFQTTKNYRSFHYFELMVLTVFAMTVSPAVPVGADTTSADSSSLGAGGGGSTPMLKGSAEDKERMRQSVKLMLDAPARPPAPLSQPTPRPSLSGSVYTPPSLSGSASSRPPLSGSASFVPFFPAKPHFVQPYKPPYLWGATPPPPFRPRPMFTPRATPSWNYTLTPSNGIMTWGAGYNTSIVAQPRFSSSLDTNINWSNHKVSGNRIDAQQQAPSAPQLKATALILPEAKVAPPTTWDEWYERVAHAIYEQWKQQTTVGAGNSIVLITAYRTHDVDCKIVDFSPAADVKRDLGAETRFRDASLRSVTSLNRDPVWEFPVSEHPPKKIVFDMQFKHGVGETGGCEVVHMQDNKALGAEQDGGDAKNLNAAEKAEQLAATLGITVSPGPCEDKRKALLGSIAVANDKGIGINTYVAAFQAIDKSVTSGTAESEISEKVASLQSTLDEQFKRSEVMKTEQLGPPVAGFRSPTRPQFQNQRRRRNRF